MTKGQEKIFSLEHTKNPNTNVRACLYFTFSALWYHPIVQCLMGNTVIHLQFWAYGFSQINESNFKLMGPENYFS